MLKRSGHVKAHNKVLLSAISPILLATVALTHHQENVGPDNKPSWDQDPSVPASTQTPH